MGPLKRSQSMVGIVNKKKMPLSPQGMEMKAKMVSYVEAHGGHRPVHTILIANNGMAATKAMISMREWAYDTLGDAKAVTFVAMASAQDLDANAEFVRLADRVVEVVAATGAIPGPLPQGHGHDGGRVPESRARIGYPVMLKASEGGGGKGIRMSHSEDELKSNFVQRRFQKIFEEAPAAIAKPEVFREMEKAAMRLTQSIGYSGAGTVEYLYHAATDKFYFLELNPRLQVEHPCTEGITFINMPATQLQVAMGIPLHRILHVRRFYGLEDLDGSSAIDFFETPYPKVTNHIIAARITAENPDEGFQPTSGSIHRVKFQSTKNFGHLFASGATREIARRHLVLALKSVEIRGVIRNPVEYLVELLETDEFKENRIDTGWLDGILKAKSVSVPMNTPRLVLAAVIFSATRRSRRRRPSSSMAKGQLSTATVKDLVRFPSVITYEGLKYDFSIAKSGPETFALQINGQTVTAKVRYLQDDGAQVNAGEPYVEVEAMKMIMALKTAESGAIKHEMSPGSIISTGDLLASLTLSDPSSVVKIEPFTGTFDGYECDDVKGLASELFDENPNIAVADAAELLGAYLVVEGRYAGRPLDGVVRDLIAEHKDALGGAIAGARAHQAVARTTDLCFHICEHLLETYTDRLKSGVKGTPPTLGSVVAQLAALPGDKYSDLALLALRVSLAASDDEPTTPRTLDTKLFNKSKLTKGYALMELETGTPFGTAFLGNKTGFGTVSSVVGAAALDLVMKNLAAKLAALHVDSFAVRVGDANFAMASPASTWWPALEAVDAKVADDFVPSPFAKRRATARRAGSTFCYDFVGMVAWHMTLKSAEYPSGRELVVIANDVTFQSGSFGVPEDDVYKAASVYARARGIPRIYVACNSGARIGLVEELKPKFKVKWNNEANPGQGFEYVYLDRADYEALEPGTNPRSGTIAGETSRAYQDGFTLSYVTGRSVGIGAYLVRLGQRTIQMNAAR
ncbi:acetyl-CoA carboxylase [Aureococcus anophagefferens]|nr:acetyl-CoA carboxylase [Aureococcus anophagefferens]